MTLRAILVEAGHRQPAGRFEYVRTVRIMTLHAIHVSLEDGMGVLGQVELGMRLQMAGETRRRVFSGIYDELSASTAGGNMFAARSMAGFAPGSVRQLCIVKIETSMSAGRKVARDIRMAIITGRISHIRSTGYLNWHEHRLSQ